MKANRQDKHSKRGLLNLLSRRRKMLLYLERYDPQAHARLMSRFGIRLGIYIYIVHDVHRVCANYI